jgi:hypothetical protein
MSFVAPVVDPLEQPVPFEDRLLRMMAHTTLDDDVVVVVVVIARLLSAVTLLR